ncbi:hypothetical protein L3Q82_023990 [Scortum barcoo]|uniref:Uncharacterized protein n=1 Tax=Scortum barcoo TaxID=214431 RepID=A0ACB8WVB3_9TELE|nr:hypothetical protein L3Q82_023990 [Scortum barcoo]
MCLSLPLSSSVLKDFPFCSSQLRSTLPLTNSGSSPSLPPTLTSFSWGLNQVSVHSGRLCVKEEPGAADAQFWVLLAGVALSHTEPPINGPL